MDASFCSIEQILVYGRLCSITEPNWTIGVRWGLISEHSIRYTLVYCNICIIFSEHGSPFLKRFLNSTLHWLVDLRWYWQGWSRWLISGDVLRCIVICWEVKFPVITSKNIFCSNRNPIPLSTFLFAFVNSSSSLLNITVSCFHDQPNFISTKLQCVYKTLDRSHAHQGDYFNILLSLQSTTNSINYFPFWRLCFFSTSSMLSIETFPCTSSVRNTMYPPLWTFQNNNPQQSIRLQGD